MSECKAYRREIDGAADGGVGAGARAHRAAVRGLVNLPAVSLAL